MMNSYGNPVPQFQIKTYLKQIIYDKGPSNKDQRLQASIQLQKLLLSVEDIRNLNYDWNDLICELRSVFSSKANVEVKKAVAQCIGTVGYLMSYNGFEAFVNVVGEWIRKVSPRLEEEQALCVASLSASLRFDSSPQHISQEAIANVMSMMKKLLEENNSAVVLVPILDIVTHIARYHPIIFRSHFDDVVDFTIGWSVDIDQNDAVIRHCHSVLVSLRPYWLQSVPYTYNLLRQFLDDADAHVKEAQENDGREQSYLKYGLLMRAFSTILEAINVDSVRPAIAEFLREVPLVNRLRSQVESLNESNATFSGEALVPLSQLLIIVLDFGILLPQCNEIVQKMMGNSMLSNTHRVHIMDYFLKVIDRLPPELAAGIIQPSIGSNGCVRQLILSRSSELTRAINGLYTRLLTPQSLPILQTAYACVRGDLMAQKAIMLESTSTSIRRDAENSFLMLLSGFSTLAATKNSLIAAMGLNPSLFHLLMDELCITESWFIRRYPWNQFVVLYLAKLHSETYGYFLSNSDWLVDRRRLAMVGEAPTARHSSRICVVLTQLLREINILTSDARFLLFEWLSGFCAALTDAQLAILVDHDEFRQLSLAVETVHGYEEMSVTQIAAAKRLISTISRQKLPPTSAKDDVTVEIILPCVNFYSAIHFRLLCEFFLRGAAPFLSLTKPSSETDWHSDVKLIYAEVNGTRPPAELWNQLRMLLMHTANFCVENRLKTPFGKPIDTFLQFENELRRLAKSAAAGDMEGDESTIRVRSLLHVVEQLDKLMYNAYEGTVFPIAAVSKNARHFFRTNRAVCSEWLSRNRLSLMTVAFYHAYYALVVRVGGTALAEIEQRAGRESPTDPDLSQQLILSLLTRSFVQLGAHQSLHGLYKWTQKVFHKKFYWIRHAAAMANGMLEKAVDGFEQTLSDDQLPSHVVATVTALMTEALIRLRNVNASRSWLERVSELELSQSAGTPRPSDVQYLRALTTFDAVNEAPVMKNSSWNLHELVFNCETRLRMAVANNKLNVIKNLIQEMTSDGELIEQMDRRQSRQLLIVRNLAENFLTGNPNKIISLQLNQIQPLEAISRGSQAVFWSQIKAGPQVSLFDLSIMARKTGNPKMAESLLEKQMNSMANGLMRDSNVNIAYHLAKLRWQHSESRPEAIRLLTESAATEILRLLGDMPPSSSSSSLTRTITEKVAVDPTSRLPVSRTLIRLARLTEEGAVLTKSVGESNILWAMIEETLGTSTIVGDRTSSIAGALYRLASRLSPQDAKTHNRFADWAYRATRRADDGGMLLTEEERWRIFSTILGDVTLMEKEALATAVAGALSESAVYADAIQACSRLSSSACAILSEVWLGARKRLLSLYEHSVMAYFDCIEHSETPSIVTVWATLRILKILVKHSDPLLTVIADRLSSTNVQFWTDILPQLFSRLNHPDGGVRDSLVSLLQRIAAVSPHSLCFPVIIGSASATNLFIPTIGEEGNEEEEDEKQEQDRSRVLECCERVRGSLETSNPILVSEVALFVKELQRINLLHQERWALVLNNLQNEMSKRLTQLESEAVATRKLDHLSAIDKALIIQDKIDIASNMILKLLEDLFERTCMQEPETINERHFVKLYKDRLIAALESYREHRSTPENAWRPLAKLMRDLGEHCHRRLSRLNMIELSPMLCESRHDAVPLPGQERLPFDRVITIARIAPTGVVLSTKTRPKKIALIGSDGKEYSFLLKGQEDMHLDERIMQLLHLSNQLLNQRTKESQIPYSTLPYSVTPLGTRSGLIQWVEGATSIYHLYRKWQLRQAMNKVGDVERPSDLFYNQLKIVFEAKGISRDVLNDRQCWPAAELRQVLEALIRSTPQDLLAKELWMRTSSADSWWQVTERFARTTAVMSMLGSVLGLGDRHLDNVLVDLRSGHVVHIDFNICFDKGKHLRVPETVPFRLTGNIATALGPTQVEGTFRKSCEHVLGVLRTSRELVLTILEAFVYDPLVDWATNELQQGTTVSTNVSLATLLCIYGGDEKRQLSSRPIAQALLAVKIREFRLPWMNNREALRSGIGNVAGLLEALHRQWMLQGEERQEGESNADFKMELAACGQRLRVAIGEHHTIMSHMRPILRSLSHSDETMRAFLRLYKERLAEPLYAALKLVDGAVADYPRAVLLLRSILTQLDRIYETLIRLADNHEDDAFIPDKVSPPPGFHDNEGHVANTARQQDQNVHARVVLRRVRHKLEGRVEDGEKQRPSPIEQVDSLIRQATSLSSLSLMYEGWTAWV